MPLCSTANGDLDEKGKGTMMRGRTTAMKGHRIRVAASLLLALLMALSLGVLAACGNGNGNEAAGNEATGNEATGNEAVGNEATLCKATIVLDITAAIEEGDPIALEIESTLGATKSFAIEIPADTTVLEALRATSLQVVTESASFGEYVTAINLLESGALGAESGWIYLVNDEQAMEGADVMKVNDGDTITWRYVTKYE
jgi:hypothetical protein